MRQLTFGEGTNESPSFSANGRHIAFMSTRSGKSQIFTIARTARTCARSRGSATISSRLVQVGDPPVIPGEEQGCDEWFRRLDSRSDALRLIVSACGGKKPPVARPLPPPPAPAGSGSASRPPAPPEPVAEPTIVPPEPVRDERISSASLDDLNRNSPLKPAFFEYDSSELTSRRAACAQRQRRTAEAVSRPGR